MRKGDTGGRYFLLLVRSEAAQGAQKEGRYKSAEAAEAPFRRVEQRTARRGAEPAAPAPQYATMDDLNALREELMQLTKPLHSGAA